MSDKARSEKLILVVDDEQSILRFVKIKLRASGYEVITTTDGKEALKFCESRKPDCMLLDLVMPGMDGFTVLEKLRAFSQMPVIVLSARNGINERIVNLGASDFISKPFNPDDLIRRINVAMSRSCQ